jgi:hypothetical protein
VDEDAGGNAQEVGGRIDVNALYDDGNPRSLQKFNQEALGNERFISIEHGNNHGLHLTGKFHSKQWGDFQTYFRFQISSVGKQ